MDTPEATDARPVEMDVSSEEVTLTVIFRERPSSGADDSESVSAGKTRSPVNQECVWRDRAAVQRLTHERAAICDPEGNRSLIASVTNVVSQS